MNVSDALERYHRWARFLAIVAPCPRCCVACFHAATQADAASIALDMANASASDERIRAQIAW